ncbi:hypothetical protein LZ32DRAFT_666618 [Colletotrichum eremochloae]|nr:hypothetical protein LZ32DRAFT_666618 [Colletotrichum eremochloae]
MRVFGVVVTLLGCARVQAKAVFAHFMVENAKEWSVDAWKVDIQLAQQAHIDGFALNIRQDDASLGTSLGRAFEAAEALGFKMIFSYDYAAGGPWGANRVIQLTQNYAAYSSYYHDEKGRPLVSTFEGPGNAKDWEYIIQKTNALFLPDWSSLGAKNALAAAPCVPHGLFSWEPWPWGNTDSNTYVDASYLEFLNTASHNCGSDMKYMMPASPWFYTNLPGYKKNWLWRGDDLWFARWEQIRFLNPDYVQIISWNDFGESHYIGPLYVEGDSYEAFKVGQAPFNYALDMPHDGWRDLLPFTIDLYKTGIATVSQEKLVAWYRLTSSQAGCDDGWTTGNTVSQLQLEFWPHEVAQDRIFYSALLAENKPVTVTVGGVDLGAKWDRVPSGGVGIYHGSVEFGRNVGDVVITVGSMTVNKRPITGDCGSTSGYTNWNAFVASTTGAALSAEVDTTKWVCTEGTAAVGFDKLCEFTCKYGYCPPGACYCTKMGPGIKEPDANTPGFGTVGYPAQGKSASYQGLCKFACNLGFCPSEHCGTTEYPTVVPTVSPFTPDACTSGTGKGALEGLCDFSCNFGFCPVHSCTCLSTGPLHDAPAQSETVSGKSIDGLDERLYNSLCEFACSRGYSRRRQPAPNKVVYVACESPCVMVLPPKPLGTTTIISIPPYTTSLEVGKTTTTITLSPTPVTTDKINFSNINVTGSVTDGGRFATCTSLVLDPVAVTLTYITDARTTITTRDIKLPPWPQMTQDPPKKWTSTCGGFLVGAGNDDDGDVPIVTPTQTTTAPLPRYTDEFPPADIEPIIEPLDNQCSGGHCPGDAEDNSIKVKCDELWFFNFCVNTERLKVYGWKLILPPGIIGPYD